MQIEQRQRENLTVWMEDPMTKFYFEQVEKEREYQKECLASGLTVSNDSVDATAQRTVKLVASIAALEFCTTFEFEKEEGDES